jgi:hypothetical protein
VDEAGHGPLEELLLAQHDDGLVPDPLRRVTEAVDRLAEPDEIDEQLGAAGKERAANREECGERNSAERDVYGSALPRRAARTARPRSAARIACPRAAVMTAPSGAPR